MDIKPIETQYKGYRFRSRLEARWAVFFDSLDVEWEYEKEGFDLGTERYLPDFWLPTQNVWIEIKGERSETGDTKAKKLADITQCSVLMAEGSIGDEQWTHFIPDGTGYTNGFVIQVNKIPDPIAMFLGPPSGYYASEDWGQKILCPFCQKSYVNFYRPTIKTGDDYTCWQGRGQSVSIEMTCESGCHWSVRFGFHKGETFIAIENAFKETDDIGLWLAKGDKKRYETAVKTARSARFEFGERG